jgi:large subunit ribosomal protein L33
MAKKGPRIKIGLICSVCKSFNYVSQRSKLNTPNPLKLKKYCPVCKKHTDHQEKKKL